MKNVLELAKSIVIIAALAFVIRYVLLVPIVVNGESMVPSFADHDRVIVTPLAKWLGLERFDVIVFESKTRKEKMIKRVIGLPGDRLEMKNDHLTINGKVYDEPYLKKWFASTGRISTVTNDFTLKETTNKTVIPEGYIFVLGDNRAISFDSREYGLVPIDHVIGKAIVRVWPWQHVSLVE